MSDRLKRRRKANMNMSETIIRKVNDILTVNICDSDKNTDIEALLTTLSKKIEDISIR